MMMNWVMYLIKVGAPTMAALGIAHAFHRLIPGRPGLGRHFADGTHIDQAFHRVADGGQFV